MSTATEQASTKRGARFLKNVLWNWFAVCTSLFTGLVLSPYIIRKLGDEGNGVWALIFAFVEYYWLMDMGLASATSKYAAHYRALGEPEKVNEVINSGLAYATCMAGLAVAATLACARYMDRLFPVPPGYRDVYTLLIMIVGTGWALGGIFNVFSGCMEGFQRFDVTSRIWMAGMALRSAGLAVVLAMGFGLKAMGLVVLGSLLTTYLLNYLSLRMAVFPQLRISARLATRAMFRQMLGYGAHTFLANVAQRGLTQSTPLLIDHFLPTAFVGYYRSPVNLLQYSADLVNRVGYVTGASAAEMAAKGELELVARMGLIVNRYCYVLFAPLAIALSVYGTDFIRLWLKSPGFVMNAAPLLPVLAVGTTLGIAAQYNSSSILYGLGKHQGYARSLTVEAILSTAAMLFVIPRWGILGAAYVSSALLVLNRGLYTSWLLSQNVGVSFWWYLRGIYLWPTLAAVPALLAGMWVRSHWLAGLRWPQLLAGMAFIAMTYYALAFFICVDKEHRAYPKAWLRERLSGA